VGPKLGSFGAIGGVLSVFVVMVSPIMVVDGEWKMEDGWRARWVTSCVAFGG
jgi:hypothetical protein